MNMKLIALFMASAAASYPGWESFPSAGYCSSDLDRFICEEPASDCSLQQCIDSCTAVPNTTNVEYHCDDDDGDCWCYCQSGCTCMEDVGESSTWAPVGTLVLPEACLHHRGDAARRRRRLDNSDPPQSPPPPPSPPHLPGLSVQVDGPCPLTDGGACATSPNYPDGEYGPNEWCEFTNVPPSPLVSLAFDVEGDYNPYYDFDGNGDPTDDCYDYLIVNGVRYCGTSGPTGIVPSDGNITWVSDEFEFGAGWKICWANAPPQMPPRMPPRMPRMPRMPTPTRRLLRGRPQ